MKSLTSCRFAFPHDELHPTDNTYSDMFGGWGASAFDALSTAIVMEIPEIVETILNYVPTVDWSCSRDGKVISLFETTIRYLGGMLSAYDLLSGPFSHLAPSKNEVAALLDQSRSLAKNLSYAFDTPTGIPHNQLFLCNRTADGGDTIILAAAGSLVLEWTRLSDLTEDKSYAKLAQTAESYLLNPQPVSLDRICSYSMPVC